MFHIPKHNFRLFLVITFNGLVSMMCAAVFIELERPEQLQRFEAKDNLRKDVEAVKRNLTYMLQSTRTFEKEVSDVRLVFFRHFNHVTETLFVMCPKGD